MDAGKSEAAHIAIAVGAKVLAGAVSDMIENPQLLKEYWQEFNDAKAADEAEVV